MIFAGYKDRMARFFESNPGMSSRIAHHIDFPDYQVDELALIAERMLTAESRAERAFLEGVVDGCLGSHEIFEREPKG